MPYDDMMYSLSNETTVYSLDEDFVYVEDAMQPWLSDVHYRDELDDELYDMPEPW